MSAVIAYSVEYQPADQTDDNSSTEPESELEEQAWEPRRIRVPRVLVWAILLCFVLLVVVISIWGLARGTWWY
jgi:hypothetical protein